MKKNIKKNPNTIRKDHKSIKTVRPFFVFKKAFNIGANYTTKVKTLHLIVLIVASFITGFLLRHALVNENNFTSQKEVLSGTEESATDSYWFELHRKSNIEFLYFGKPGNKEKSQLVREFKVKTGVPGKKPTPLPELLDREYWVIISKMDSSYDPETAPYFLTLDVPITDQVPYGPGNYNECGGQCNWEKPGYFGLHGVGGDATRLLPQNEGSSGCIRHSDQDITYIYNLIDPTSSEVRYYVKDI